MSDYEVTLVNDNSKYAYLGPHGELSNLRLV